MLRRRFACLVLTAAIGLSVWFLSARVLGEEADAAADADQGAVQLVDQPDDLPAGRDEGEKEAWESEFPPGWEQLSEGQRKEWTRGLKQAKSDVEKHGQARIKAATRALEMAARKGVPTSDAATMAKGGLDEGLAPEDFGPLGKSVTGKVRQGMRGRELAAAIHAEIRLRHQHRRELREQAMRKKGILKPTKAQYIHRKEGAGEAPKAGEEQEEQGQTRSGGGKGQGNSKGGRK